jgi:hypothetical protein
MKVGDHVDVWFSGADALFNAEVEYIPCAIGDSWELRSTDGLLHKIMVFEKMSQLSEIKEARPTVRRKPPVQLANGAINDHYCLSGCNGKFFACDPAIRKPLLPPDPEPQIKHSMPPP